MGIRRNRYLLEYISCLALQGYLSPGVQISIKTRTPQGVSLLSCSVIARHLCPRQSVSPLGPMWASAPTFWGPTSLESVGAIIDRPAALCSYPHRLPANSYRILRGRFITAPTFVDESYLKVRKMLKFSCKNLLTSDYPRGKIPE